MISEIFRPFEDWSENETYFGLCVKDGKIIIPKDDGEDYDEWHIDEWDGGWMIECAYAENAAFCVYVGEIPSREFFVELMKNVRYGFNIEKCEQ
jgi:hypothetical protein